MLEEIAAAGAGSAMKGAIDSLVSAADEKRKDRYWREHQDILYKQQMRAQRESMPNLVDSYKMAGLNPAAAAGGSAMSVAGASPANGSEPHAGEMDVGFGKATTERNLMRQQQSLMETQKGVNDTTMTKNLADAHKADEEAGYYHNLSGQVGRSNRDFDEKRFFFSEISMQYLGALREQAEASNDKARIKVIDNLLDMKEENPDLFFSPALVDAFNMLNSGTASNQQHYTDIIQSKLREMVAAGQLQSSPELNALIHAPSREATLIWKQIEATSKNIELLSQQKTINEADLRKIEAEIIELGKSADRMDAETKKAYSSDVTRMLKEGDYLGAGLEIFKQVGNPLTLALLMARKFPLGAKGIPVTPPQKVPPAPPAKPVNVPLKGTKALMLLLRLRVKLKRLWTIRSVCPSPLMSASR